MSIVKNIINSRDCIDKPCGSIELIIKPQEKELGEFTVRRILPTIKKRMVGPWLFFDHMGPASFPSGKGINVRPHPHINLATVTYLFDGEIWHRDSLGNSQSILPGDINLMVAGHGIAHSERTSPGQLEWPRTLHGLQLWLALPKEYEEIDPAFYHYPSSQIPSTEIDTVPIRVMIGSAYGVTSPVKTYSETLYLEARLKKGQSLDLPDAKERVVYVAQGALSSHDTLLDQYSMAVYEHGRAKVTATKDSYIAIIGGKPLGQRHMFWNFASSRKDRIEKAKVDWKEGRFTKVVDDEKEFIPLPE